MVRERRGIGFEDNGTNLVDSKCIYYRISKQICSKSQKTINRIQDELYEIDAMSGTAFEDYCITLFELSGILKYANYRKTKKTGDYGADIIIETAYGERIGVQCKRLKSSPVRVEAIQEIVGSEKHYKTKHSIVITNSRFTENAQNLAFTNGVLLIDRDAITKLIKKKMDYLLDIEKKTQWENLKKEIE